VADETHSPSAAELEKGLSLAVGSHHVITVPTTQDVELLLVTPRFAPGKEIFEGGDPDRRVDGETCSIRYRITDQHARLTAARLEISRKSSGAPVAIVQLDAADFTHGKHAFEWDGKCTEGDMADKYVHALWSPYAVKIVAEGPSGEVSDDGMETAVEVAGVALARGRYVPEASPPDPKSEKAYQLRLTELGFHAGQIDGQIGDKSKRAIKNFQRSHSGLSATGDLDDATKAYLDEETLPGTGVDHYQYILSVLGYRCGAIDGLVGKKTKRALTRYRADKSLPPGDALDDDVKAALDAESIPALVRREILEGDLAAAEPHENPLPDPGTEKKIYVDGDSSFSPGSLPYHQKFSTETANLIRPHLPLVARPLVRRRNGTLAFAPAAVSKMRVDFTVGVATPPPADLGIPAIAARTFVKKVMGKDGGEATTGYHAHKNRGGVRTSSEPGVFLTGKAFDPYDVALDGAKHKCTCVETDDDPALGTAGVYFVPSTISGDRFSVVATINAEGFDTAPKKLPTTETGTMIVWRRYRLSKLWLMKYVPRPHKTETARQMGLPPWYEPAFIQFVEIDKNPSPLMVQPRGSDPMEVDLALYTAILREAGYKAAQLSDAQIKTHYDAGILWPLRSASVYSAADEQGYYDAVSDEIGAFEERFSKKVRELSFLESYEGLVTLVFDENAPAAGTMGLHAIKNRQLQRWAWSLLASEGILHLIWDQDTDAAALSHGAIDGETLAHEYGHALWLHHSTTSSAKGAVPDPADQPEHNKPEWNTCTMSYIALPNFCGRCVLKLRGWDEQKL
jgi:peptidoglycan hydrolase-like protein with peptidoglycan-binding domain